MSLEFYEDSDFLDVDAKFEEEDTFSAEFQSDDPFSADLGDIKVSVVVGEPGGYYVPEVSEDGELSWSPSREDMPAVAPGNVMGPAGDVGPQGEKGDAFTYDDFTPEQLEALRGPQGIQGVPGEPGAPGAQGEKGEAFTFDDFTAGQLEMLRGPQGIQGERGERGEQGIQGVRGEVGPAGPQGIQGEAGPRGDRGETGATGPQGERGESGVYVGSGDIPDGYNVQIIPDGNGESLQDMIGIALQEAKDSGEFDGPQGPAGPQGIQGIQGIQGEVGPRGEQGERGERGFPGKDGQDGTVTFDELTDAQKSQLTAGITDDLAESFEGDMASTVKITPSGVFAQQAYATMLSRDTFTVDTLKVFTVVEKNAQAAGNYYGGHVFIGLYKDDKNYLKLYTSAYNLVLDNVVNGAKTSTTITSIQSTVTPCSDICTVIDFIRNKLELRGLNNGVMTTIVDVDMNTLDLSYLDSFKLMCGAGKYGGYQANIYARINDYFDYATLMHEPLYMSNYNTLPVVDAFNTAIYEPTTIALGGTITSSISATHKITEVSASPNGYFAFGASNSSIANEAGWGEITRFKVTNISEGLYFRIGQASTLVIWDEDGNVAWDGTGYFYPEADKWYYKYAVCGRTLGYGASYNLYAYGTFTMELEAICICQPKSQNMCAETWNGKCFTGVLPFEGTGVSFINLTGFNTNMTGKFVPVGATTIGSDGAIYMYNGSRWVLLGN